MNEASTKAPSCGGLFDAPPSPKEAPNDAATNAEYEDEGDIMNENEDDDFIYSQLDTIAEEEEDEDEEEDATAWAQRDSRLEKSRSSRQKVASATPTAIGISNSSNQHGNQLQQQQLVSAAAAVKQENNKTRATTTVRPQAANFATASSAASSNLSSANNGGDISANSKRDTTTRKHQQEPTWASKRMQQQPLLQPQQLPSTNRLISEHQARQQQTLFKALAERQKLMDELDDDDDELRRRFDLMSSSAAAVASLTRTSLSARNRRHHSHSHSRSHSHSHSHNHGKQQQQGVPLSAVDLSSMSDGMLDELLGHIASASSSSLSSQCGESLDSSDLSCSTTTSTSTSATSDSDSSSDEVRRRRRKRRRRRREEAATSGGLVTSDLRRDFASPNVVGVHEEPVAGGNIANGARRSASACREAHRRSSDDHQGGNGDDDDHKQQLVIGGSTLVGDRHQRDLSLSPVDNQSHQTDQEQFEETLDRKPTKLEQYFTSGLVEPHHFGSEEEEEGEEGEEEEAIEESVEEVLARMLSALQEIGTDDQERLNELLERGFAHLEQLLQYSLAPATNEAQPSDGSQQAQAQGKLANQQASSSSSPSTLLLSKDSDYGSDTQSADCLSGQSATVVTNASANQSLQQQQQDSTSSPAPSSLNTNSSNGGQRQPAAATTGKRPELSPLAIELSFKLAESLHRLAQQQQQQQTTTKRRETDISPATEMTKTSTTTRTQQPRMKSIVMINSSPLPSTCSSSASPSSPIAGLPRSNQRNLTPSSEESSQQQHRSIFKTRVNIGGGSNTTQVVVVANNNYSNSSEPPVEKKHQDLIASTNQEQQKPKVQQQQVAFERRRSLRNSSMRRRLAAANSQQQQQQQQQVPLQPRPGSPLPRSCLQQQEQVPSLASGEANGVAPDDGVEAGGKLQRALVLAQKYNYSPAKLAASKLSAKLQLSQSSNSKQEGFELASGQASVGSQAPTLGLRQTSLQQKATSMELQEPRSRPGDQARRHSHGNSVSGEPEIRVSGSMELDISYFAKTGSLTVHVLQCSQLAAVSKRRTTSNPYVKLYLLPDRSKSGKRKSSIQRSQLEPKFDEKFTFGPLQLADFAQKILWLSVWHKDRLGRNEFLGELLLPMNQVRQQLISSDLCQSTGAKWYPLQERVLQQDSSSQLEKKKKKQQQLEHKLGELQLKAARLAAVAPTAGNLQRQPLQAEPLEGMRVCLGPSPMSLVNSNQAPPSGHLTPITGQLFVALKFVVGQNGQLKTGSSRSLKQAEGELHVMIKEAHNIGGFVDRLPPPAGALPNPFCKCYLLNSDGRRLTKQKTPHLKRTVNPRWDHRCTFGQLRLGALASQAIEIQMFNRDSILVSNEHLGGVRLCRAKAQGSSQQQASSSSTTITNINTQDDATSIASSERSSSVDGSLRPGLGSFKRQDSSTASNGLDELDGALCSERESRLWTQMMSRPNIWVYGELKLRHLPPLIPLGDGTTTTTISTASQQ